MSQYSTTNPYFRITLSHRSISKYLQFSKNTDCPWLYIIFTTFWLLLHSTKNLFLFFAENNVGPYRWGSRIVFFEGQVRGKSHKNRDEVTVFENHRKSLIQHCERIELRLHFERTKVNQKCPKWSILAGFWKPEACGQTVLPDRSVLIGQKINGKCQNSKIENATFLE